MDAWHTAAAAVRRAALVAGMIAGLAAPGAGQVLYGSIVVEVRDDRGAAVPGADVTIVQAGTNWTRQEVSGANGLATFVTVPPGTFPNTVTMAGFKEAVTTGVAVTQNNVGRDGIDERLFRTGVRFAF